MVGKTNVELKMPKKPTHSDAKNETTKKNTKLINKNCDYFILSLGRLQLKINKEKRNKTLRLF